MAVSGAKEKILEAVSSWSGVSTHPHRFGGIEFKVGKRELGHLHGDRLLDIPFPLKTRNELIGEGRAEPHHILPRSGWISFYIETENDVEEAVELMKLSYAIAIRQKKLTR